MFSVINIVGRGLIDPSNCFTSHTPCNILEGAVGSLLGGVIGAVGQANANKANIQMNRENNEANQQLANKQNQWNIEQWNRENDYNSAIAQKDRLLKAGMNPYFSEVNAGSASSVQSANLANQNAPAPVGNVGEPLGRGIGAAGQSAFDSLMAQQLTAAQVEKAKADAVTAQSQAAINKLTAKRQGATMPFDIESAKNLNLNQVQQNALLKLQTENQDWANMLQQKYGNTFQIAELENLAAQKWKTVSDRHLNEASLDKIASEVAKNYAEGNHLNADTKTINAIRSYVVNEYKVNNTKTEYENNILKVNSDWQQKHGAESLNQQLDAATFENSNYSRYVKPLIPGATAVGGALILKGKGKPYKGPHSKLVNSIKKRSSFYSGD